MVGALNKLPVAASGMIFFGDAVTFGSVSAVGVGFFAGLVYAVAKNNQKKAEQAAQAGIIPSLKRVIDSKSPLKQFALPIFCDLASAGKSCRVLLWQHDGLSMYLKLLDDPYFQVSALESILSWSVHIPGPIQP